MKLNVITGLPRAGSTLLCNILNQNPRFHATSTSDLPAFLSNMTHSWTNSVDVKNELNIDRVATEDKMLRTMRAYVEAWHACDGQVVFDKSRGWSNNILMLQKLYPDAKAIVMIRDLRNVFASVEKQHRKFPLLDDADDAISKTVYNRADKMFSPKGIIGMPIVGIEDILNRKHKNIVIVKYEELAEKPETVMRMVYEELGEDFFKHDFKNVKNTAVDPDGFYLHKFPHKGEGEVKPCNPAEWKSFLSEGMAKTIMDRFKNFNGVFGYE